MHVTQTLHRAHQHEPDRVLTVFGDRTRTVAESRDRIARLAGALKTLGLEPGDRVGIFALNSDRYHEFLLAVPWAGGVVNPVNIRWSPVEVAYSLVDCETNILFVDDAFAAMVPTLREQVPNLRSIVFCGDGERPEGAVDYEELVAATEPVQDAMRGGSDLYGVFYTGGTTGHPKGVMLSHDSLMTSAMGSVVTLDVVSRGGVLLHSAPMFHLADIAAWLMGMLTDGSHVIVPAFAPGAVVEAIEKHRVTDALLVPTMIQMLADSPEAAAADLSRVRGILYGASVISEAVLQRAKATLPNARFTQAYGMTELGPIATLLSPEGHDDPVLVRSCGRSVAHAEVRIFDEADVEVTRGTVGEICVRGDHVMQGYWNKPEETAVAVRGGWMHTGDGGYMDERGYVFVVDRIKDMIITGGENVYSAEVENALAKHPAVEQCAVIGVPDTEWGERVHAVVVLKREAAATETELRDFCRGLIANYKLPRSVAFVDALPMSGAGKILKRELRKQYWGATDRAVQ
ncbi:long-chain-fatty-acid--CoA ligase [Saccharopolyspora sp. ASAGF58]|uniref:long-chain-fatty-acid--CoA ligase n=1 Tax=Saccharopolyspora sp. ASAGF58 TaxID=2719023 RepID=UPI00143FBC6C|nr:long-chain-fatty-acid--CoA ligase [Saccharopolyspora sp. ASAGF58]QIZ36884.1 long-chain-fatty-acid--CoA ligase [Saccharopolyspora sp. ASAGF58]